MTERAADPTPEALEFYCREVLPWLMRYATTPSAYQDRNGAQLLDAFARAAVEKERERAVAILVSWLPALTATGQGHSLSVIIDEVRSGGRP